MAGAFKSYNILTFTIGGMEMHHRKRTFEQEYIALLKMHGVPYDPKFALLLQPKFHDPADQRRHDLPLQRPAIKRRVLGLRK
jgi:hypothetical protein